LGRLCYCLNSNQCLFPYHLLGRNFYP
jgi:hypothetical protein